MQARDYFGSRDHPSTASTDASGGSHGGYTPAGNAAFTRALWGRGDDAEFRGHSLTSVPETVEGALAGRYRRKGHSTSGSFADLVINHPEVFVLRILGRDRVKLWGTIRAREPAFLWWLASRNTDWHQDTQLATMPMEDCDIGDPAFGLWMLEPFSDAEPNIISALVSGATRGFQTIAVCTCCAQREPIDNFVMTCTTSTNQGVPVCGNCVYKGVASTCDVEVPTIVCLEANCEDQGSGHEHVILPLMNRAFRHSQDLTVQALLTTPPISIYVKASFYSRLLNRLAFATREPIEQRVLDALLVSRRDQAGYSSGPLAQEEGAVVEGAESEAGEAGEV